MSSTATAEQPITTDAASLEFAINTGDRAPAPSTSAPIKVQSINAEQFRNSVFFSVTISRWGNRAKVKQTGLSTEEREKLKKAGTLSETKTLLRSPALDALNEFLTQTKERLCGRFGRALKSRIKEGLFVLNRDLVQEYEDQLNAACQKIQNEYLPAFLADYPAAINRARFDAIEQGGLGPLWDARDYPSEKQIRESFGLTWQWLALGVPEDLPAALRQEAAAKLERQFSEAADEVKNALRVQFGELLEHASEKLKVGEDGKRRVFRDSLIGNIQSFLETFQSRNLMNDEGLSELVTRARQVLNGVTPEKCRQLANVAENTAHNFEQIKAELDKMITTETGRKFHVDTE